MFINRKKANRACLQTHPLGRPGSRGSLPEYNGFGQASCPGDFPACFLCNLALEESKGIHGKPQQGSGACGCHRGCLFANKPVVGREKELFLLRSLPQIYFRHDERKEPELGFQLREDTAH